jgi:hypothetical protein
MSLSRPMESCRQNLSELLHEEMRSDVLGIGVISPHRRPSNTLLDIVRNSLK